jgi:hypothetical protein
VERSGLVHLAEQIPDDEVDGAVADLRRRLRPVGDRPWPPRGSASLPVRAPRWGARSEELLADGFGR